MGVEIRTEDRRAFHDAIRRQDVPMRYDSETGLGLTAVDYDPTTDRVTVQPSRWGDTNMDQVSMSRAEFEAFAPAL